MSKRAVVIAALQREPALAEDAGAPLYHQLQVRLRDLIEEGVVQASEAIPPERDLAAALGVSRITVRKAVQGLVQEGLLAQRQGAGTFVVPRVEQPLSRLTSFSEDMVARGMTPAARWLERSVGSATPEEAVALNLSPGAEVARLHRLRSADGEPMALERATIPRIFLPDPAAVQNSLYEVLAANGYRPERALQYLRAELLDEKNAALLGVSVGSAALYIKRYGYLADGRVVEYTRSHYRGNAYDFVAEMHMEGGGAATRRGPSIPI
jgi:GntR family transcriptional regulator